MNQIQLPNERAETLRRVAVARCVCRLGRYPVERDIESELRDMHSLAVTSSAARSMPTGPTEAEAAAYLRGLGLAVPAKGIVRE